MNLVIAVALVALAWVVSYVLAFRSDRRWRKAGRGWRLPRRVRALKRFKAKARMWQWGEFVNERTGMTKVVYLSDGSLFYLGRTSEAPGFDESSGIKVLYSEPKTVTYRDFRSFIRLWPNPGFQVTVAGEVIHWCRNPKCPTPRRRPA